MNINENGYFGISTQVKLADEIELNPGESHITVTTALPDYFKADTSAKYSTLKLSYESGAYEETNVFSVE